MVGILAILQAIRRLVRRDLSAIFAVNNFFLFIVLIAAGGPSAIVPFVVLVGLLLLFPLCADPLHKVPASRLNSWPLDPRQRVALRVGSLTLSPVLWIAILLLCAKAGVMSALLFLLAAAAVQGVTAIANFAALRLPPLNPLRSIPQLPVRLGGIIRIALRQMLSVLDFYVSAILSLAAIAYRTLSAHPDPEAFPICAVLVALGLSTFAQQMFGLDSASGIARYRLMPLAGWKILLGKDIAYFTVLILLVLPLNLGAGLTFGLAAVALGRYPSLRPHHAQLRRRFVSGDWRFGACQIIAGFALGISNARLGSWFFAGAAAMYVASLFAGGWFWDHRQDP